MVRVVKTRVEIEGEVHEETVVVDRDEPAAWEAGRDFEIVGKPVSRMDGRERVTGAARYTYDVHPAGLLYAAVLRCPYPHARVLDVDMTEAEKLPGVRAVLSMNNAPDISWYGGASSLFGAELRFAGEEVAAVAADDLDIGRDALKLVKVAYEELPFVTDMEEAIKPGAPQVHLDGNILREDGQDGELYERGNLDEGFNAADVVIEATYRTPTALHNSFETHGSVAMWEGEELTVWSSTQYLWGVRDRVARALQMPLSKVRVICEYMGGGFGSKGQTLKDPVIASLLARASGRAVQLMLDRREENLLTGNRGATVQHYRLGATKEGMLCAIELEALYNLGVYGTWAGAVAGPAKELYKCANVRTRTLGVRTNLGTHAAFRAPGFVEGTFGLESAVDELCAVLGMDPLEFRRKNHASKDQTSGQEYSSKHLLESYDRAMELMGLDKDQGLPAPGALGSDGPWRRGIGMASQMWSGGGGPPAHALVRFNSDGSAEVMTATQDIGTGTKTALAQVAAEELGLPLDKVRFRVGDTQRGPFAPASWGSITVPSMAPAVRSAAQDAKQQLLEIASYFLEVPVESLQVSDGNISIEGQPQSQRSIADILDEIGDYMITGKGFRGPNPPQPLRTWGAQLAEVSVNLATGQVRVERVVAVHDVGRVINPMGLGSQFQGGILQGMGLALTEERKVDGRAGIVLNANLEEYKIPSLADTPVMVPEGLNIPDTLANHVGSKGAGEPPIIPAAPAIVNAIYNATGVRIRSIPVTPWRLIEAAGQQKSEHTTEK